MKLKFDTYSHLILLTFLLLMLVLFPFFSEWSFSTELFKVLFTAILISSAYTLSHQRINLIVTGILGVLAIVSSWADEIFGVSRGLLYFNFSVTIAFFIYVIAIHINQLISQRKIGPNLLYAALCGYILIGILWGCIYSLFALVLPDAFYMAHVAVQTKSYADVAKMPEFIYYSFITLTTLGYGDIVPVLPAAQSFATLEAISGQFYLTVLVARLVALYVSQRQ